MKTSVEHARIFRDRAEEFRRLADYIKEKMIRETLSRMARDLDSMARQLEDVADALRKAPGTAGKSRGPSKLH